MFNAATLGLAMAAGVMPSYRLPAPEKYPGQRTAYQRQILHHEPVNPPRDTRQRRRRLEREARKRRPAM